MTEISLVPNNFIKNLFTTKSSEYRSLLRGKICDTCTLLKSAKKRENRRHMRQSDSRIKLTWLTHRIDLLLVAEYCDERVSLCVCVFLFASISPKLHIRPSPVCVHVGLYLAPWLVATLRYVMYFRLYRWRHGRPYAGVSVPLQWVTSPRRRAQANAPAASYWSCPVSDDGRRRSWTSLSRRPGIEYFPISNWSSRVRGTNQFVRTAPCTVAAAFIVFAHRQNAFHQRCGRPTVRGCSEYTGLHGRSPIACSLSVPSKIDMQMSRMPLDSRHSK